MWPLTLPEEEDIVEDLGTPSVSVLLVDDSPVFLHAAALLIRSVPGMHLAGFAGSGEQAIHCVERSAPDIALIDIRMDGIGGIEAATRITELRGPTTVVLITAEDEHSVPKRAHCCGAAAILCKQRLLPATVAELRDRVLADSTRYDMGSQPATVAPRPGPDSIESDPPSDSTRSRMLVNPTPVEGDAGSNPRPSSDTENRN
ncbi:MAG: hypothetical protein QOF68_2851 [Gaiellales bacterium]|nr:hypothetical protein [Gaiellales bacterium]